MTAPRTFFLTLDRAGEQAQIGYLKNYSHGEPLIVFVGGRVSVGRGSYKLVTSRAVYKEREAIMWVKRLAKYGYEAKMVAV